MSSLNRLLLGSLNFLVRALFLIGHFVEQPTAGVASMATGLSHSTASSASRASRFTTSSSRELLSMRPSYFAEQKYLTEAFVIS
jgi:hypothetical protein